MKAYNTMGGDMMKCKENTHAIRHGRVLASTFVPAFQLTS
jgi:hypothetical protein